jgi:mono/diheme cytochrome c family protein
MKQGAESVHVIGCPAGDCAYGVGNKLAEERMEGERRPRVPARAARSTTRDFVAPTAIKHALSTPGTHLSADTGDIPKSRSRVAITGVVVLVSVLLVGLATTIGFSVDRPESGVLVVVNHEPGRALASTGVVSGAPGTPTVLRVLVGDELVIEEEIGNGGKASAVASVDTSAGETTVLVELIEGEAVGVVYDESVELESGRRLVVEVTDEAATDAEAGEGLFFSSKTGCSVCHSVEPGVELVGPNLSGVANIAGDRVPGLTADEYLLQSIVDPNAYVVEGFPAGQMLDIFEETLSSEEIDALVAYLLTLDG